ncbi:TPA: AAA family ATPase [Yersinia enterocolitica]|nr:ATP-binding protein [Yersinia enterocolitica]EKN5951147.1 ATP-binding protein [Yersinia enterocolitica]HEI6784815.1 AAA family ATPase [Yersinia enterocolitica]
MNIIGFEAKKVYGYLDVKINFNKDVTFLVGGNGSGKTTILRIMQAILNPNIKELVVIPFESADLIIDDNSSPLTISVRKDKRKIDVFLSSLNEVMTIPNINNSDEFVVGNKSEDDEIYQRIERDNFSNEVYLKLKKMSKPIFLGLDRRSISNSNYPLQDDIYFRRHVTSNKREVYYGTLGEALIHTEMMVQDSYRRIRNFEEKQGNYLIDKILKSSFKFTDFNRVNIEPSAMDWMERENIIKRKEEIKNAINKIGTVDDSLIKDMDSFFNKITTLFEELRNSKGKGINVNWLMNKAQIDRVADILDVIDASNSRVSKLYGPINSFINLINKFFIDSGKKIEINTVGRLEVIRPDGKKCTIDSLSSGERQLLIMTANVFFNKHSGNSGVIVIDEPELSLHMRWQEMFSEHILNVSPKTQFIMATHSPEIVGELQDKCIAVGR